jgi:DNA-binding CsgD family transcriptional regulator
VPTLQPRRAGNARSIGSSSDRPRRPPGQRVGVADVGPHTRAERVAQIEQLECRGMTTREVAERLGLARSMINIYRADPDGKRQRQRRRRYQGACANCGRPTSGSGGPKGAPERCRRCAGERRRSWSEERILDAIRAWAAERGSPPRVRDWSPAHAPDGNGDARRYRSEPGRWPSASVVAARFGSFCAALERAGMQVPRAAAGIAAGVDPRAHR